MDWRVPVGSLLRGAAGGDREPLPASLAVIAGQDWSVNLQELSALEISVDSLTGGIPDPHQTGHAVGLGFTAGLTPDKLRLDKPPGLERISRVTLADQAELLGLQLYSLARVVALHQTARHLHTGVEGDLMGDQLSGSNHLDVVTAGAVTDVQERVLLLPPEALDPALDSDWPGQVREGREGVAPHTGQVTLPECQERRRY